MKSIKKIIYDISYSPAFLFLAGAVPLSAALISQYFFDKHPCPLCIYQRYPFVFLMLIALLAMFIKNKRFRIAVVFLGILTLLANTGLAFFHFGVEQAWWTFGECSAKLDLTSVESLQKFLFEAPNIRCDEVQFELMNISMAGWNVIYCFGAAVFFLHYLKIKYLHKA